MALDRKKPYGTVHGDPLGRLFEQDGVFYDANGEEWKAPEPTPVAETPAIAEEVAKKKK